MQSGAPDTADDSDTDDVEQKSIVSTGDLASQGSLPHDHVLHLPEQHATIGADNRVRRIWTGSKGKGGTGEAKCCCLAATPTPSRRRPDAILCVLVLLLLVLAVLGTYAYFLSTEDGVIARS